MFLSIWTLELITWIPRSASFFFFCSSAISRIRASWKNFFAQALLCICPLWPESHNWGWLKAFYLWCPVSPFSSRSPPSSCCASCPAGARCPPSSCQDARIRSTRVAAMCSEPFERWDIPAKVVDRLLWDWSVLNNLTGQSILKSLAMYYKLDIRVSSHLLTPWPTCGSFLKVYIAAIGKKNKFWTKKGCFTMGWFKYVYFFVLIFWFETLMLCIVRLLLRGVIWWW